MELLLELARPGSPARAVRVECDPTHSVHDLARALGAYLHTAGAALSLRVARTGEVLAQDCRAVDAGLVSGDLVELVTVASARTQPSDAPVDGVVLEVVAGPDTGTRVVFTPGVASVGREGRGLALRDSLLARVQFDVEVTPDLTVWLTPQSDAGAPTLVDGEPIQGRTFIEGTAEVRAGATVLRISPVRAPGERRRDLLGQIPFNRTPYRRVVVTARDLGSIRDIPHKPEPRRFALANGLLPLLTGLTFWAADPNHNPRFLFIAALTPVVFVYGWWDDRRSGRARHRKKVAAFRDAVAQRARALDEAVAQEAHERHAASPDLEELARRVMHRTPQLWERDIASPDFLELRVGLGNVPSRVQVAVEERGDEDLREEARAALAGREMVEHVPVTVPLATLGAFAIEGADDTVVPAANALIAQAAALHSPEDLVIAAMIGARHAAAFEWMKWLPHTRATTSPLAGAHLAAARDAGHALLRELLDVAAVRNTVDRGAAARRRPWVLVVIDEAAEVPAPLVSELLDQCPEVGISVCWLGAHDARVPRQCRAVLQARGDEGRLWFTDPDVDDVRCVLDAASVETVAAVAKRLAPVRDASTASMTTAIPRAVPLLEVLGAADVTAADIEARWRTDRGSALCAPIGVGADGVLSLDLVAHGPHALIGGTSGSGKSELLQTLVCSLAAHHPATRLNFLFVDYKGGAATAELRDLPHTVGYVTNLDPGMALRSLTSLRAELRTRMALLEGKAKDIEEMLTVDPEHCPPSLVIVVDEFATLVKEIPDFVNGIVDIAQRGRSLGIHLVLATQRPSGAVNENILANTNLRIALRVLDPGDSVNIIGAPDAADIPHPLRGRAYVRTGPRELVPFQCAYAGAPYVATEGARPVVVEPFTWAPAHATHSAPQVSGVPCETHLTRLRDAIIAAHRQLGLPAPRRPWVEPLPRFLALDEVLAEAPATDDPVRDLLLGWRDEPDAQRRVPYVVDVEHSGGLLVFGTGGSGRSSVLRTAAASVASRASVEAGVFYVLDFGGRTLGALTELPHCAGYATADDAERVTRILQLLDAEVTRRREVLARHRVENLSALRAEKGTIGFARVLLLVDNIGSFERTFERSEVYGWSAMLQQLVTEGRQVGIHLVATADRRASVANAILSAVAERLVLRMADADAVVDLGVPPKIARQIELGDGRGLTTTGFEVQLGVAVGGDDRARRVGDAAAQARWLAALAQRISGGRAPALPELPEACTITASADGELAFVLGVADLTLAPVVTDLRTSGMVVAGPPESGRSTALRTIASGLAGVGRWAIGTATSPLAQLDCFANGAFARDEHARCLKELEERLARDDGHVVLFVDDADAIDDGEAARMLQGLVRHERVRVVASVETRTLSAAVMGWMNELKRVRRMLFLQPEPGDVFAVTGQRPLVRPGMRFPPGRGILLADRTLTILHVGTR